MPESRKQPVSKLTAERNIPGAFEGETITRRRLMVATTHTAGAVATAAVLLPALGDLDAVAELADVIALCAQAHAEGDPARADAVWNAGAAAVAGGPAPDHQAAKRRWRGA